MDSVNPPSDALLRLAEARGVASEFWGFDGTAQQVEASTLVAVLGALGVDASTPERIDAALSAAHDEPWRQPVPPTVVVRAGHGVQVPVHVSHGEGVEVWIELEQGGRRDTYQQDVYVEPRSVDGRLVGRATFALPWDLPLGYHRLHASSADGHFTGTLIVTPQRLDLPAAVTDRRAWGLMAQLYSVRSSESWGVGDLQDLADLAGLAGRRLGADFLLINPLHAAEPTVPMTPSPYLPTTRRFVNPLYLRVESIPETAYLSAADRSLVEWAAESVQTLNRDSGPVDRDAAWTAKKSALEVVFAQPRSVAREAAFQDFKAREGEGLELFATWSALTEHFGSDAWPAEYLDPQGSAVAKARVTLAGRIEFFAWLQWVSDEQLGRAQHEALSAGMSLGIMHDLAVGVHTTGADAWGLAGVLAKSATVGAPPDMYNQQGQNWTQPPWHPWELARVGYAPYRDLLRTVLRHAGAIRIDHVIGLFRLWWIPEGSLPSRGAYVRYDHEALIGILCLEAHRSGALVIGEDLGTFEPWVRDYLTDRGILGTSVLWFEKTHDGHPLPPEHYRRLALATVTTHDLPPTAGYLAGEHVDLREELGLLSDPVEVVRAQAEAERDDIVAVLRERGLVGAHPTEQDLVEALHRFIKQTPALLLGVSLADAVGERRAQNQPGTDLEYPNWKIPLGGPTGETVLVDDLFADARLSSLARAMNEG